MKQVFDKWDILPPFQHLYHNGIELKENSDALGGLGLLTDDTVYVVLDVMPMEDVEEIVDDEGEDEIIARVCAKSLAGFTGTALFGLTANSDSTGALEGNGGASRMIIDDSVIEVEEDDPVQCKQLGRRHRCQAHTYVT